VHLIVQLENEFIRIYDDVLLLKSVIIN